MISSEHASNTRTRHHSKLFALLVGIAVLAPPSLWAAEPAAAERATLNDTYPGLASGILSFAVVEDLPEGVLLRSGSLEIGANDIKDEVASAPESVRESLTKNGFFLLEQLGTSRLLLAQARQNTTQGSTESSAKSDEEVIQEYLREITANVQVTDDDVREFYEENKDACGGATFEQMKDQMKPYVLDEARQNAVTEHIRSLGRQVPIAVSASWLKEQAVMAKDNPVDQARSSGLPSVVDFGATGCRPCDMMVPILADLKKKYQGKVNVLFVHVQEEQVLAARYGIRSIPVQVFFDKDGNETCRHTGFFPQPEIEKRLLEMGIQ